MAVTDLFEAFRVAANKPFLDDAVGRAWQRTLGRLMDESFARVYEARLARFPTDAPSDGLQYIAAERGVERAIGEAESDYREVLRRAWELWRIAGSQDVHKYNLGRMGCQNVIIVRRREFSGVAPGPTPYVTAFARDVWAQFDVILENPMPWRLRYWDPSDRWGTGVWGTTATSAQLAQVVRLLRTFRAGHDTPTYLWMHFGGGSLWGIGAWGPPRVWGGAGPVQRLVVGEPEWKLRGFIGYDLAQP